MHLLIADRHRGLCSRWSRGRESTKQTFWGWRLHQDVVQRPGVLCKLSGEHSVLLRIRNLLEAVLKSPEQTQQQDPGYVSNPVPGFWLPTKFLA